MFKHISRNQLIIIILASFIGTVLIWGCIDSALNSQNKEPKMRAGGTSEFRVDIQNKKHANLFSLI